MARTPKAYRPRRGHVVAVEFLDHVEDGVRPLSFVKYGRIDHIDVECIVIDSWAYSRGIDERAFGEANISRHTIVRSAVTKITRLVPAKE
jgi:hypothetical protein